MARSVRFDQLRLDARLYADQRPGSSTSFVTDTECKRLVNQSLAELYDLLVAARGHEYYLSEDTGNTAVGTATYSLPADHYETKRLTLEWGTRDNELVTDYHLDEEVDLANFTTWGRWSPKAFRVIGTSFKLVPTPQTVTAYRLQYVPAFSDLVNDDDTFDGVNGWEKLVTLKTAIELRAIEESDYGDLARLYQEQLERVQAMAADRAANETKRVRDVSPETDYLAARRGRLWGLPRP